MMEVIGRQNRTKLRDGLVTPPIEAALLELTIPDKPRSRMQKYRTTEAGLAMANAHASRRPPALPEKPPDGGRGNGS